MQDPYRNSEPVTVWLRLDQAYDGWLIFFSAVVDEGITWERIGEFSSEARVP